MIQESKFLGGDLLHTHLVKGLDYALLNKVKAEINHKEKIQEAEMEKIVEEQNIEVEKQVGLVTSAFWFFFRVLLLSIDRKNLFFGLISNCWIKLAVGIGFILIC